MARKRQDIKVILHPPEDQKSIEALQDATNQLFARIIENTLSKADLTPAEKECVVRRVIAELAAQTT